RDERSLRDPEIAVGEHRDELTPGLGGADLPERERGRRPDLRLGVVGEAEDRGRVAGEPRVAEPGDERALLRRRARGEEIAPEDVRRAHRGVAITGEERLPRGSAERVRARRADLVGLVPALGVDAHEEAERRTVGLLDEAEALDEGRERARLTT